MGIEIIMTILLAIQVFQPSVDNGHYTMSKDEIGIIRMDTATGKITRCNKDLTCEDSKK